LDRRSVAVVDDTEAVFVKVAIWAAPSRPG